MLNRGNKEIALEETEPNHPPGLVSDRAIAIWYTLEGKLIEYKPEDAFELISYCNALALKEHYEREVAKHPMVLVSGKLVPNPAQRSLNTQITTCGGLAKRLKIGATNRRTAAAPAKPRLTFAPRQN